MVRTLTSEELRYANLSVEELELIVGEYLLTGMSLQAKPRTPRDLRLAAKRWFKITRSDVAKIICGDPTVKSIVGDGTRDRNALIGAIIDLLQVVIFSSVPAAALATMIVHYGIDKLCPEFSGH